MPYLIHEVYPKVKEDLAEASAQGDRSDNAGYREARRMQGKTISRIEFTNLATNTRMRRFPPESCACESRASRLAEKKAVDFETATGSPFQLFKGAGKSQQLVDCNKEDSSHLIGFVSVKDTKS